MKKIAILGIGNILELDDGVAIYATKYLEKNYIFSPQVDIINGGVEGINLLNLFMEYEYIFILDAIEIEDTPGSIYHIPSDKLTGYGLNSGGAHEIGVLQCFDILELMGKELPQSSVFGIIPEKIDVAIGLSETMRKNFLLYIEKLLEALSTKLHIETIKKDKQTSLDAIIEEFKNPLSS